ncbi:hypothetical protein G7Z17_g11846 [Cylindrodendrum hubeiense]|uniref:NB-ARC domain-containing protein n=1 Tax=Cylindrodendrum hubeiense TaxID=595255 RepID=A0A9P5GZG0_9HYPO|nr:hypothetical protein G7Z17_g11846 [Cylindrodendrum hubeiense]
MVAVQTSTVTPESRDAPTPAKTNPAPAKTSMDTPEPKDTTLPAKTKSTDTDILIDKPMSRRQLIQKMIPKIGSSDTGLKIQHEPLEEEDIEVDIVAVHGIGVHPKKTWIHRRTEIDWLAMWFGDDAVKQSLDSVANKLLRALKDKRRIQDNAIQTMAHDNEVLRTTVHDFTRLLKTCLPSPELFCFFEQKATKVGIIVGLNEPSEFVVNESSGTLNGYESNGLELDHFHMNKFENNNDESYQCVKNEIVRMKKGSTKIMQDRTTGKSPPTPSSPRYFVPTFAAPIAKEENFAPRDGVLQTIDKMFRKRLEVVLCGDSGSGKTHVAVEYAHKYLQGNPGSKVHWVNASSVEQLHISYKGIAQVLHLSKESQRNHRVVEAVQDCLKQDSSGAWLMVLDGLEKKSNLTTTDSMNSGKSLMELMPTGLHAKVLITTRSKRLAEQIVDGNNEHIICINPIKDDDALTLLGSTRSDKARMKSAIDLAKTLQKSAGALTLAQSYLKKDEKHPTVKQYLKLIGSPSDEKSSAARAWELLHDLIRAHHPEAAELMLLISALDVQCVPDSYFSRHDAFELIPILQDYGVVEPSQDRRIFYITSLFRLLGQKWLADHGKKTQVEELALHIILRKFKEESRDALLPCALAVLKFQLTSTESKRDLATLLSRVSEYYIHLEQPHKALAHLEECLASRKKEPDLEKREALVEETKRAFENARELASRSNTKKSLAGTGKRSSRKGFEDDKQFLELEKSDAQWQNRHTVQKASDVAARRMGQSQYEGPDNSVALYQRVVDWLKGKDGVNPLDLARNEYNLALAQDAKGQYDESEKLYCSALSLLSEDMKLNKPDSTTEELFLKIFGSLAAMYCAQAQFDKAEAAFQVVLPRQLVALGQNHPETLVTRHNVALLMQERGEVDKAADELQQVLMAQHSLLGSDDPVTLRTACSVALNLRLREKYDESRKVYREVLKSQKEILGKTHTDTVRTKLMLKELVDEMELKGISRRNGVEGN